MFPPPPSPTLFPYTTLFRSSPELNSVPAPSSDSPAAALPRSTHHRTRPPAKIGAVVAIGRYEPTANDSDLMPHRSEEHTSELQSPCNLVCRLLLEKKKTHPTHVPLLFSPCSPHHPALHSSPTRRSSDLAPS